MCRIKPINSRKLMKSHDEIISTIQQWFVDKLSQKVDINENYIDSGLIDSFDMINLIVFIESNYKISFTSDDLQDNGFLTINGLGEFILRKISDV
jgi:acyl carrier protein